MQDKRSKFLAIREGIVSEYMDLNESAYLQHLARFYFEKGYEAAGGDTGVSNSKRGSEDGVGDGKSVCSCVCSRKK